MEYSEIKNKIISSLRLDENDQVFMEELDSLIENTKGQGGSINSLNILSGDDSIELTEKSFFGNNVSIRYNSAQNKLTYTGEMAISFDEKFREFRVSLQKLKNANNEIFYRRNIKINSLNRFNDSLKGYELIDSCNNVFYHRFDVQFEIQDDIFDEDFSLIGLKSLAVRDRKAAKTFLVQSNEADVEDSFFCTNESIEKYLNFNNFDYFSFDYYLKPIMDTKKKSEMVNIINGINNEIKFGYLSQIIKE